jgi:ankyrin repeat protein
VCVCVCVCVCMCVCVCLPICLFNNALTDANPPSHSLSLSRSFTFLLTHSLTHSHSHTLTHIHTRPRSLSLSHVHMYTRTHSLTQPLSSFFSLSFSLSLSHQPVPDEDGETALSHAAENGCLDILKELLTADNVDVNGGSEECNPPLIAAARQGHVNCVTYLLKSGANPSKENRTGETALIHAIVARKVGWRLADVCFCVFV